MATKTISKLQRLIGVATKAVARADLAKRRARLAKVQLKLARKASKAAKKAAKQARRLVLDAKATLIAARLRRGARKKPPKTAKAKAALPGKRAVRRKRTGRAESPAAVARSIIKRMDAAARGSAHSRSPAAPAKAPLPPAQGGEGTSGP